MLAFDQLGIGHVDRIGIEESIEKRHVQQPDDVGDPLRIEVGAQLAAGDAALEQGDQPLAPLLLAAPAERTQMRGERDRRRRG